MIGQYQPGAYDYTRPPRHGRKTPANRVMLGTGQTMVLADHRQRFRARIADSMLIGIGFAVAVFVKLWVELSEPDFSRLVLPYVAYVSLLLYEIVAVAWRGKTLGMGSMGIRVVSIKTGHAPSMHASLWRGILLAWVVPPVLYLVLYDLYPNGLSPQSGATSLLLLSAIWVLLAHLSVFWSEDRRGWPDLISGTVVVTADPPVPAGSPGADAV